MLQKLSWCMQPQKLNENCLLDLTNSAHFARSDDKMTILVRITIAKGCNTSSLNSTLAVPLLIVKTEHDMIEFRELSDA